jgi:NAD(P)-dependent dehydrogenase (short-subunit alcohol dehydrogenase family)
VFSDAVGERSTASLVSGFVTQGVSHVSGVVIIGSGPGLGRSIARVFAKEGLPVALLARRQASADAVAADLEPFGVPTLAIAADSTDEAGLKGALDRVTQRFGLPDVVVYNAARIQRDTVESLSVSGHLEGWAVNVGGVITTAAHLLPRMAARGSGSFLVTGGMPEPVASYTSLSLGKAGVRALVTMLDEQYGPAGVHVATVTVYGTIAPGTSFDPDDIATHYVRLHDQSPTEWELETRHIGA